MKKAELERKMSNLTMQIGVVSGNMIKAKKAGDTKRFIELNDEYDNLQYRLKVTLRQYCK